MQHCEWMFYILEYILTVLMGVNTLCQEGRRLTEDDAHINRFSTTIDNNSIVIVSTLHNEDR